MPYCSITSNVAMTDERKRPFLRELSSAIAQLTGKPESYVMVEFVEQPNMLFAGSDDPLCMVAMKSLGLPEERTKEFSSELSQLVQRELGIGADRCYIEFAAPKRHMWGFNGTTFG